MPPLQSNTTSTHGHNNAENERFAKQIYKICRRRLAQAIFPTPRYETHHMPNPPFHNPRPSGDKSDAGFLNTRGFWLNGLRRKSILKNDPQIKIGGYEMGGLASGGFHILGSDKLHVQVVVCRSYRFALRSVHFRCCCDHVLTL